MKKLWQVIAALGMSAAFPAAAQYQQVMMQQQYPMSQQQMMMAPQAGQYPQQYQQQQLGEQRPPIIMANDNVKVTCPGSDYRYNSTRIQGNVSSSSSKDNDH